MEIIFEFIGELLLQIVIEALAELGWRSLVATVQSRPHPLLSAIGHILLGLIAGTISLLLFPHLMMASHGARVANLIVTPIAAGLAMSALGAWRLHRGQVLLRLDRFTFAYLFALALAAVRFGFGS
jgi:hypothetical protein